MIKSKKQMFIIIGVFTLIMMLGTVSYAFFNYTRTGAANNIRVGSINFNSEHGNVININNVFPIDKERINIDTDYVGSTTIHITGDTNYEGGIEYLVSAINVNNTVNDKEIPINIEVTYTNTSGKTIGTLDEDYYKNRGNSNSIYKKVSDEIRTFGNMLVVGYIAPNETGIDGTITVKAYIDKDKIAITDTYPYQTVNTMNENPTQEQINACATYMEQEYSYYLESGESYQSFCNGTGTLYGMTFSEWDSNWYFYSGDYDYFKEIGMMSKYTNHTSIEWIDDRTYLTTEEWNSLQTNGLSFQIKVEANEGIWAKKAPNAMENLPYFSENFDVKEIYFNNMDYDTMHERYDQATIKKDITYHGEGEVLAWLETNQTDNTKYNLYIASDGDTYLTTGSSLFYGSNLSYIDKVEFNNVDTSRVTSMTSMFYGLHNLKVVDVRNFDTSNVTNMHGFVYNTDSVEEIYMQNLDLRKVIDMGAMFQGNRKLKEVHLEGVKTRDVVNMGNLFYSSTEVENINLEGLGGDNLEQIGSIVSTGSGKHQTINMKNFNFGKIERLEALFYDLEDLESVDLSGAKMNSVTSLSRLFDEDPNLVSVNMSNMVAPNLSNIAVMFRENTSLTTVDLSNAALSSLTNTSGAFTNCSALTTVYVSNTWNNANIVDSDGMFSGCTSIVGGNGTVYDSTHTDKEYARIDTVANKGYFTEKNN